MNKLEHLGRMVPEVLNSDDVLATYKERNVTAGMVTYWQEVEVMTYSADGTIHTEKPSKKEVVDRVLRSLILLDEAEQAGLTATDEQVNAAIAEQKSIAEEYPEIREQLEEYWEAAGACAPAPACSAPAPAPDVEEGRAVTAPLVGTYYAAPGPEQPPFVKAGDRVKKGETLCLIEAMKMMSEVAAPCDCEILQVLKSNGDLAAYGETLFRYRAC